MITIVLADYTSPKHAHDILTMMSHYAKSEMGGAKDLSTFAKENLIAGLKSNASAFSLLAYNDKECIGLANCFMGFSTFKCKPLINIHDFVVKESMRGQGIAKKILDEIEEQGHKRACCKITLEVLENNSSAQQAYRKFGFGEYVLTASTGKALFWEKPI